MSILFFVVYLLPTFYPKGYPEAIKANPNAWKVKYLKYDWSLNQ